MTSLNNDFPVRSPTLQIGFYQRLKESQKEHLLPALLSHVGNVDIGKLDAQLLLYVKKERLAVVAKKGLRGELIYPVPYLLETNPKLIGYYRLLYGFSQKEFYQSPYSRFKRMEDRGEITTATDKLIPALCESLVETGWLLVNGLPNLSEEIIRSLTLLTLGPQFRGSRNVNLGVEAIQTVFALIRSIVSDNIISETDTSLFVRSAVNRQYQIEFAPDPDIAIRQLLDNGSLRNRIAIEVKGGTDFSNIHNRLGEAEKSHQKAKSANFTQFWTVVNVGGLERRVWKQESPTTNELFVLDEITDPKNQEHVRFREYLVSEIGI